MSFVEHLNRWKRCFQSSQFSSFEKSSFSGRSSFNISSTLPLPQYQTTLHTVNRNNNKKILNEERFMC